MTPTNDAPVTVEQCDRDRAADHLAALGQINAQFRIRTGMADEHSLVQTLARHRLAALASAPAPSWSETPEHIRDHLALLAEVELHLQSSRVFVTTREKMHPCGVELHDELLGKVTAAIETIGKGQAHG